MAKLIFGCGYLGSRVVQRWHRAGETVFVVTRSDEKARGFEQAGYRPIVADVMQPASLIDLPVAETVLYAIGYEPSAAVSMRALYVEGLQNVLARLPTSPGKFIYISSTGVYGQTGGQRVDERSPCEPTREGGRACLAAEQTLAVHAVGRRAIILRMAGLYGPGRIPSLEAMREGRPISAPSQGFLNLIHVDDAAEVVLSAERVATPPRSYVVSDGHPVERRDYYAELARLLAAGPPRFATTAEDSPAAARAGASKRIDNSRMLAELDAQLAFCTFREGLAAIVADQRGPPT